MLVVGAGGSGKSTVLSLLAAQTTGPVVRVGGGGEQAWDAVTDLIEHIAAPGTLVLIDDLDALTGALPPDYARELLERLELSIRSAGESGILVVAAAQRLTGGVTRIAELLPRRLVLAASSRAEHVAAGGDPAHYVPGSPPGRGRLDGRSVQVAMTSPMPPMPQSARPRRGIRADPSRASCSDARPGRGRRSPRGRRQGHACCRSTSSPTVAEWADAAPIVIAGEADEWQRHWRILSTVRSDHDLVIDSSCGPELRLLTGERGLPPYCEPGRAAGVAVHRRRPAYAGQPARECLTGRCRRPYVRCVATTPISLDRPEGKGLAAGTLGLWGSTVIGLASTAPVYSLVATLGFVVLAVGAQAPVVFIIAFIPMLFIAFAYRELNNEIPDCGTTFTWATKAFGPWVGWLGGWGVAVAGMVVLANLAQIAGIYFWALIDGILRTPEDALLADNVPLVTATGVVFIALMTWVSWRGVEIGERIQNILLGIQYLALAIFVVGGPVAVLRGHRARPDAVRLVVAQPLRVHGVEQLHRGHPAGAVHLLGLGHLPRAERGDQGSQAHPRSGRAADHGDPAGHLRRCRRSRR